MLLKRDALEREENLKLRIEIFGFEINKQTNKHNSNTKRSLSRNLGEHRSVRRSGTASRGTALLLSWYLVCACAVSIELNL